MNFSLLKHSFYYTEGSRVKRIRLTINRTGGFSFSSSGKDPFIVYPYEGALTTLRRSVMLSSVSLQMEVGYVPLYANRKNAGCGCGEITGWDMFDVDNWYNEMDAVSGHVSTPSLLNQVTHGFGRTNHEKRRREQGVDSLSFPFFYRGKNGIASFELTIHPTVLTGENYVAELSVDSERFASVTPLRSCKAKHPFFLLSYMILSVYESAWHIKQQLSVERVYRTFQGALQENGGLCVMYEDGIV